MPIQSREPLLAYLLVHAAMIRRRRGTATGAAEHLEVHAQALEVLADLVRELPDDDERLLTLSTIAVRDGQFTPGAGAERALNRFTETSRDECEAFLTMLVRIARDDALVRARARTFGASTLALSKLGSRLWSQGPICLFAHHPARPTDSNR
jgi:hypothetical protein